MGSEALEQAEEAREADRRSIAGHAGIVAAGTLTSRVLGLGREQVLAAMFSRASTDVFMVAFVIPNVLRQLLAEGAVQSAVLPVLAKTKEQEGDTAALGFFERIRGLSLFILLVVCVLGVLGAPVLVDLFAHGYRDYPGQYERTVTITRWIFPYIFFMGTFALGVAALNTHKRFVATAFAPGLLNVSFIVFALALPSVFVAMDIDPLMALAVGVLVGGVLQVMAQWPSLHKIGYLTRPKLDLSHPGVREVLRRMVPVLFGIGVYYVDVIIARHMLSTLGVGAQSYFGFALRLCDFPQGIFVMAVSAATLPALSRLAARQDHDELAATFAFGFRLALFVAVAASALFVFLAEPIVALIFQRGHFSATDTEQTARALMAQGAGIWAVAGVRQLVSAYYAVGDTRTPVFVSAIDLVVFIVLAVVLKDLYGHVGISMAVAGASMAQLFLLWVLLKKHIKDRRSSEIVVSLLKSVAASALAVWAARLSLKQLSLGEEATILTGLVGTVVFGAVFLLAAAALRSSELRVIASPLGRLVRRRKR